MSKSGVFAQGPFRDDASNFVEFRQISLFLNSSYHHIFGFICVFLLFIVIYDLYEQLCSSDLSRFLCKFYHNRIFLFSFDFSGSDSKAETKQFGTRTTL